MLSHRTVPTTPFANNENTVGFATMKTCVKTPAATKARRAFGDISNRKVPIAIKSAAAKSVGRFSANAAVDRVVASKSVRFSTNITTTAPEFYDDDDIELPAGRLGFEEDKLHADSFYECDIPNDVRFAREELDAVLQETHELNMAAMDERERQLTDGFDDDVASAFKKLDGTYLCIFTCETIRESTREFIS
jgi:hypothetical protein